MAASGIVGASVLVEGRLWTPATVPAWTVVGAVALLNFVTKATGPVMLAGRSLPPALDRVISVLPPALLAGLVVVDARLVGLAAGGIALLLRAPLVVVLVVAPAAAAVARALGWG